MTNTNEMENKVEMEVTEEVTVEEPKKEGFISKGKNYVKTHKKGFIAGAVVVGVTALGVYLYVTGSKEAAESCSEMVKDVIPDNVTFISDVIETAEEAV